MEVCGRIRTDRRTLIAEKIADAGGNTYAVTTWENMLRKQRVVGTYETDTGAKGSADGKGVQAVDERLKPFDQFGATFPEFVRSFGLCLEYVKDCFSRIACVDL